MLVSAISPEIKYIFKESCGINMDELVSSELGNIWNDETTDDIGDFSLNNLDMNNQTNQTSAEQQNIHHSMQSSESKQKLKVLLTLIGRGIWMLLECGGGRNQPAPF